MQNADCDQPNVLVHCKVSRVLLSAVFGICVFVTSDNGSIWLLVQFLAGPDVEPLSGLHCIRFSLFHVLASSHLAHCSRRAAAQ